MNISAASVFASCWCSIQQIDVSFPCICPVLDHEFRHNIVQVTVDPQTILTMTKFVVNNRTDAWKTDVNLLFAITNCQIVRSRSLTNRINCKFMSLSGYWRRKIANKRARKSAVTVKTGILGSVIVSAWSIDKMDKAWQSIAIFLKLSSINTDCHPRLHILGSSKRNEKLLHNRCWNCRVGTRPKLLLANVTPELAQTFSSRHHLFLEGTEV